MKNIIILGAGVGILGYVAYSMGLFGTGTMTNKNNDGDTNPNQGSTTTGNPSAPISVKSGDMMIDSTTLQPVELTGSITKVTIVNYTGAVVWGYLPGQTDYRTIWNYIGLYPNKAYNYANIPTGLFGLMRGRDYRLEIEMRNDSAYSTNFYFGFSYGTEGGTFMDVPGGGQFPPKFFLNSNQTKVETINFRVPNDATETDVWWTVVYPYTAYFTMRDETLNVIDAVHVVGAFAVV